MNTPKDIEKYVPPQIAGARLLSAAYELILSMKPKVRIKWSLKINYYYPEETMKASKNALRLDRTVNSGTMEGMEDFYE